VSTDRVIVAGETDLMSEAVLSEVERVCQKRQIELTFLPRMLGVTEWKAGATSAPAAYHAALANDEHAPTLGTAPRNGTYALPLRAVPQPAPALTAAPVNVTHAPAAPAFAVPAVASSYFRFKRVIDIVGALVLLVLLLPILILGGLLVLVDIGPPVFFWQERQGWKGRAFLMYKFRTLRAPFDDDGKPILTSRLPSAIGRFLRTTRMDELPQLLNVLLGEMSLIGPRPLLPEDQPSRTSIRLAVRPGISGWAQVNGGKLVSKEQKEKLDEWYVRNASLWVDLRVAWMTFGVMMRSHLSPQESSADLEQVQQKDVAADQTMLQPELFPPGRLPDLAPQAATGEKARVLH
jgi:lipopolysaccharide/colanic/teichoic acid biosynthesis glycosyltransferase